MQYDNLSKEELLKLIKKQELDLKSKKYGLVWDDEKEPEQVVLDCRDNLPVLRRIKGKEIKEPKDNTQEDNILIEGDNYHALTVLNYTHQEKIDVIYIDPPYNTGNKDFKYNDNYVDKEDGYRHSKWLNFMEKRLKLAKNLLKEDGVIFISIDDNEKAQLKLLCDNLFGELNFVGEITVKTSSINGFKIYGNKPVRIKDYILIYSKNYLKYEYNRIYIEKKGNWDSHFNLFYDHEKNIIYKLKDILIKQKILKKNNKLSDLKLENNKFKKFYIKYKENICQSGSYKNSPEKELSIKNKGKVIKIKSKTGKNIYLYNGRMLSFLSSSIKKIEENKEDIALALSDIWDDIDYNNIQNESPFILPNGQKPIKLIERIIKMNKNKNLIILDFFAGSGTTGHATLNINKKDKGNRKFILCTNNDGNICSEITYPRLKSIIKGYKNKEGLGGNLQYFKTSLIQTTKNRDQTKINLTQKCTEMLCLKENIFNVEIEKEDFKIFSSNKKDKFLCVYYNFIEESFEEFLKEIKKLKGEKIIYMFSLEDKIDKSLFKEIKNYKLETIPKKILEIYKKLVKMNIPIKAETIFIDLEKAKKQIFEDKDKDTGAKTLRVVLEKLVQKIAQKNQINILTDKGKEMKLSTLNDTLKSESVFTKLEWEENKTYLTIGNHASHGEYDEFDLTQVNKFYKHIQTLINKFNI